MKANQSGVGWWVVLAVVLVVLLAAPMTVEVPCDRAVGSLLGVSARVEATCVHSWPHGLLGGHSVETRARGVGLSVGAGR